MIDSQWDAAAPLTLKQAKILKFFGKYNASYTRQQARRIITEIYRNREAQLRFGAYVEITKDDFSTDEILPYNNEELEKLVKELL